MSGNILSGIHAKKITNRCSDDIGDALYICSFEFDCFMIGIPVSETSINKLIAAINK